MAKWPPTGGWKGHFESPGWKYFDMDISATHLGRTLFFGMPEKTSAIWKKKTKNNSTKAQQLKNPFFPLISPWSHHQGTNGSAHTPDLGGMLRYQPCETATKGTKLVGLIWNSNLASKNEIEPIIFRHGKKKCWKELLGFEDCIIFF